MKDKPLSEEIKSIGSGLHGLDDEILALQRQIQETKENQLAIQTLRAQVAKEAFNRSIIEDMLSERLSKIKQQKSSVQDEISSIDYEQKRVTRQLDKFKQINSMNDAFYVWYAGPYATINTFRLGTMPSKPIEWTEINSALGQTALAIHIISSKANIDFRHYFVAPMGSFAKVIKVDDKRTVYPLYFDPNAFSLFPKRNFNLALTAFMHCIDEIGEFILHYDPTLTLPYKMSLAESKIGGLSYAYGGDEEIWTRALKFLLSNVKWIIAWYAKHCASNYITDTSLFNIK